MFKGSYTALITPFSNGAFDEDAFRKLVDFQIKSGIYLLRIQPQPRSHEKNG